MIPSLFFFFALCVGTAIGGLIPNTITVQRYLADPAIQRFQDYLRIDTSQEDNLEYAVEFWRRQASELDLPFAVHRPARKPICIITWRGTNPNLPSIMLNSHMDIVPVDIEGWTWPPFDAHIDENGDIYARGAQDAKDVSLQYLEAIRRLKNDNVTFQRTFHITLMPDEETGGHAGMMVFRDTQEFKTLNVGFVLDEGIPSTDDTHLITYQDKRPWQMNFTVRGEGGHGSSMPEYSSVDKMLKLINVITKYRDTQKIIKDSKDPFEFGAYSSLNINVIHGGLATNVIPEKITITVDMRLSMSATVDKTQALINSWLLEAGNTTAIRFMRRIENSPATPVDDTNTYWVAMQEAAKEMGVKLVPVTCPAVSDSIYLRQRGIPAFGVSSKTYTRNHIHGPNEYLNAATFLNGIDFYVGILKKLGRI